MKIKDIAHDADVLLHDGQYGDHEYAAHIGWGHSRVSDAMEFANKANVDQLVLFHHDPYHTDDELEALLAAMLKDPNPPKTLADRLLGVVPRPRTAAETKPQAVGEDLDTLGFKKEPSKGAVGPESR